MREIADIVAMAAQRKRAKGAIHSKQLEIRDTYNGDLALPLPELHADERPAIANLLQMGLDGTAQRCASTMPNLDYAPLRRGIKSSEDSARIKRKVNMSWWHENDMDRILARRFRHMVGYNASPVVIRPSAKLAMPVWEVRDPLDTYPCPTWKLDDMEPYDVIFSYRRPRSWVREMYPQGGAWMRAQDPDNGFPTPGVAGDAPVEIIEFIDDQELVLLATGRNSGSPTMSGGGMVDAQFGTTAIMGYDGRGGGYSWAIELERTKNLAGVCTAVIPGRITLDRPMGQFDGMIGMYMNQARLAALELIAIERGVFPEEWAVARQGEQVKIIALADARDGTLGQVQGGEIHTTQLNPGYKTTEAIDRLERAQRLEGSVPAAMGGEAASNQRTGRSIDSILAAGIDYGIAEAQKMMARSLQHENERGVAVMKGFFGPKKLSWYVNWRGAKGEGNYVPNDLFDTDRNIVKYSMAGSDLNGQSIRIGQKLGTGEMSMQTGREMDPEIEDPELERERTLTESLEKSVLAELSQPGSMSVPDKARIAELVSTKTMSLFDAVAQAQKEAQARQASSGPQGTPEGPVAPGAPEAQPGLAPPGVGQEQPTMGPTANTQGLSSLLSSLRRPQKALPQEAMSA